MSVLNIPFAHNWEVRTPIVDRIMERQYVDAFFLDGTLRLSSFEYFRKHPNEARRDHEEGKAAMQITYPNATTSAIAFNGQEAYVLSSSIIERRSSDADSVIRIKDTIAFAAAVSRQIPGFIGGSEGSCIYREKTLYKAEDPRSFSPPKEGEDPDLWMKRSNQIMGEHMRNKFFIKSESFSHEAEYRMIWFCEGVRKDFLIIKCPEAIKFCERPHDPANQI